MSGLPLQGCPHTCRGLGLGSDGPGCIQALPPGASVSLHHPLPVEWAKEAPCQPLLTSGGCCAVGVGSGPWCPRVKAGPLTHHSVNLQM